MLTVLISEHVTKDKFENRQLRTQRLVPVLAVEYYPAHFALRGPDDKQECGVTLRQDRGDSMHVPYPTNNIESTTIFVMNDAGKTIARYDLSA